MLNRNTIAAGLLLAAFVGCASSEPGEPNPVFSGERVAVTILGDGFVTFAEHRVPLEDFILRLRQRVRSLSEAQRTGLYVDIGMEPVDGLRARQDLDRLLDQLHFMGVRQVKFL